MSRRPSRSLSAMVVAAMLVVAGCGSDAEELQVESAEVDEATFEYVIPAGTGERLDAGENVEVIPAELTARVGDTIRITNDDDRGHTVGPFFVGANEVLTQRFAWPGEFGGICTVHPSGQVVLTVVP